MACLSDQCMSSYIHPSVLPMYTRRRLQVKRVTASAVSNGRSARSGRRQPRGRWLITLSSRLTATHAAPAGKDDGASEALLAGVSGDEMQARAEVRPRVRWTLLGQQESGVIDLGHI